MISNYNLITGLAGVMPYIASLQTKVIRSQ